jgi:hypothetical protein
MGLPVALPSGCDASSETPFGIAQYTKAATGDHGLNRGADTIVIGALGSGAAANTSKNAQLHCRLPRG